MKHIQAKQIGLAALTQQQTPSAAFTFATGELSLSDSLNESLNGSTNKATNNKSNRVQILPDGYFASTDGRENDIAGGKWLMDDVAFMSLAAHASTNNNDFLFDYEHQTLNSDKNGQPAPAAGWFKKLDYVPGQGLFAVDVDWTAAAAQFIKNKEYRYTSAVFSYDRTTGRPIELMHVALTNHPAVDGMKAIEALKANSNSGSSQTQLTNQNNTSQPNQPNQPNKGAAMNAATQLLALLGVTVASDDKITDDLLTQGTAALTALQAKADSVAQLTTDLNTAQTSVTALKSTAALKAQTADVNLAEFVPVATYNALATNFAALKAGSDNNSVEQLLKDNADKVFESEASYLTSFGKQQGFAALKAMVDARPAIAALKTTQTQGKEKPDGNNTGTAALTAEQKYTADQLGMSHADLLNSINKEAK